MSGRYGTLAAVSDVDPSRGTPTDASPALSVDDLVRETGGRLLARSERPVRGAAVDSRLVAKDNLFVALPGERTDGHFHLPDAVERGASALLVTRQVEDPSRFGDVSIIRVADGLAALGSVAAPVPLRLRPRPPRLPRRRFFFAGSVVPASAGSGVTVWVGGAGRASSVRERSSVDGFCRLNHRSKWNLL